MGRGTKLEKAIGTVHHDYMFITDYGLGNREEWIMKLKTQFNSGTYEASDRELLLENETNLFGKVQHILVVLSIVQLFHH